MPPRSAFAGRGRLPVLLCTALCLAAAAAAVEPACAQSSAIAPPPPLTVVKRPLVAFITSRKHLAADTLDDFVTRAARKARFQALVEALADQDWPQVTAIADQIGYRAVTVREGRVWYAIVFDRRGRDPIVILNLKPRRELIIGAPHVGFERAIGEQATVLMRDVGARAVILNGADRCASAAHTACDGTTAVCGASEPYRDSDVGHNVDTLFHIAHVVLAARWPNAIVMSIHGMDEDDEGVKTQMIVSNGATAKDDDKLTAATRLRAMIGRAIPPKGTVVSCNLTADEKYQARNLCGTTNVQGRHVNGDADACTGGVSQGTGRFIHLEQDREVRDPYLDDLPNIAAHPFHNALVSALGKVAPKVP